METNLPESGKHPDRWTLIRDLVVLQAKLIVDGFRDLLLVPASLVAGIWSLVSGDRDRPGPQFYQLISLGKQSELWIDLFKAYEHAPEDVRREHEIAVSNLDELVDRLESFVVEEYERGGVTAQAKERIDKALDAIQRSRTP
ncbi:MAG: hypothetical protein OEV10_05820 [Gammaproteobacteria bacterium]|jgi:hypothetical protein|nr:hypothetical protein [Gammaproteobacteria bacterium]MDH3847467.1 hypothetical protein [Gammaproteobacteria bacterium]MDH3863470.1 hypothetical protein [Gammaproteobacteria bacterium]MDH3906889.1 hypothetical protein [Gammaproteobacteria bacterium]MDH3908173.1 hypothetical protein [Gammaproteobacteria bacterium]